MIKKWYLWLTLTTLVCIPANKYFFLNSDSSQIVSQIQKKFDEVSRKTDDILINYKREIESGNHSFERLLLLGAQYPVLIFKNENLIFWSDSYLPIDNKELKKFYKERILKTHEGSIYYIKKITAYGGLEYVVVVPLLRKFKIENSILLPQLDEYVFDDLQADDISIGLDFSQYNIFNKSRNLNLFSIKINKELTKGFWFYLLELVLVMGFISGLVALSIEILKYLAKRKKVHLGLIYLIFLICVIRILMIHFRLPNIFYRYEFMSDKLYATSWLNPSLGDLFLNCLCVLILQWYIFNHNTKLFAYKKLLGHRIKVIAAAIYFVLPSLICLGCKVFTEGVFLDSQLNFDISQEISFSIPKLVGYLYFSLCMLIFFLVSNLSIRFIEKSLPTLKVQIKVCVVSEIVFILLTGEWLIAIFSGLYIIFCLFMGYAFSLRDYEKGAFSYIISTILIFSLTLASFVAEFSRKKDFEIKKKFASRLAVENDFKAEWHLFKIKNTIENDTSLYHQLNQKNNLEEFIKNLIPRYFSNYEFNISNSNNLVKDQIEDIKEKIVSTSFEGVYLFNDLKPLDRKYLTVADIKENKKVVGQIIIEMRQKTPLNNSIAGKISHLGHYVPYFVGDFAFSHTRWGNVITSSGSYLYDKSFMIAYEKNIDIQNYRFYINGFEHFAEPDGEGGHFIVSSSIFSFGDYFSNFAFIFLFLVFVSLIILSILGYFYRRNEIKISFASRIQFYLNSAFFIPFLIVSVVIVSILNYSSRQETMLFFLDKAENMSQRINERIQENDFQELPADTLEQLLKDYSAILQADLNFYDKSGLLLASSQDYVFRNGLLSERIHPYSFMQLKEKRAAHWQSIEQIAAVEFSSIYLAVKTAKSGEIIGYLGLPFYGSKRSFDKLVVEILTTIAKIFATIFILLFLILRFSTRALTKPLRLLREKLRNTSLSNKNQPIDYSNKDEIGLLVSAYNSMIDQLEENKQALARSEKESAWREMAKQVAHEIKNPLTPMKLTLQHLLRTINDVAVLRGIKTLLGQIESLSDIASSFASYAKMPLPIEEELDIVEVIQQTIALHRADCEILTDISENEFIVVGDKNMLGRIFSNLILNGVQAVSENKLPKIEIKISKKPSNWVLIEVKDNGVGIPDEIQSKVFIPDFTTKTSGSGIGLALSKRGIEHLGGNIWFESQYGEGTTFYVEMPLVLSNKREQQKTKYIHI